MDFRFKEIMRYLIPGFFIALQLLLIALGTDYEGLAGFLDKNKDNSMVTIILFSLPVAAFFVGYFVEYIASGIEYVLYKWNIMKRPSYLILRGESERYKVSELDKLLSKLNLKQEDIKSNQKARDAYNQAKQSIKDLTYSEEFLYLMLTARNLFFSEAILLIVVILLAICGNVTWWIVGCLVLLCLVLFHRWRQRSKTLTKHVFLQYLNEK